MSAITVTVNADTAQAAQQLAQFSATASAGLSAMSAAGRAAAGPLRELRETSMLGRDAMTGLSSATLLLGSRLSPQLTEGIMVARSGLLGLRSVALLTGLSLSAILPVLGLIAVAVGAGVLTWNEYRTAQEEARKAANDMSEALKKIPEQLTAIHSAARAGILPKETAESLTEQIANASLTPAPNPKDAGWLTKLENFAAQLQPPPSAAAGGMQPALRTTSPEQVKAQQDAKQAAYDKTLPGVQEKINEQLTQLGILIKTVDAKTGKATYERNPELEDVENVRQLQQKSSLEVLSGFDKEREAARQTHDEQIDELNQKAQAADLVRKQFQAKMEVAPSPEIAQDLQKEIADLDPAKFTAIKTQIDAGLTSKLAGIDFKQQQEEQQKAQQAGAKGPEMDKRQVAEENADLERQLTLTALEQGRERGQNYQAEYLARIHLLSEQYYSGAITEKEYTTSVQEEEIKRLKGRQEEEQETLRTMQDRRSLQTDQLKLQEEQIKNDPFATESEKAQQLIPILQQYAAIYQTDLSQVQASLAQTNLTQAERVKLLKQELELRMQLAGIKGAQQQAAVKSGDVGANIGQGFTNAQSSLGTPAQAAGNAVGSAFTGAVPAIAAGLDSLIMRTKTWRQGIAEIGIGLEKDVAGAFSKMVSDWTVGVAMMAAKWVATHLIMQGAEEALHELAITLGWTRVATSATQQATEAATGKAIAAAAVAASSGIAVAEAAIWLEPAILATIASFGAAAAAAPGEVGAAMLLGLASGGPAEAGQPYIVGERGPELFVSNQAGYVHPNSALSRMASGSGSGSSGSSRAPGPPQINIHFTPDMNAVTKHIRENPEAQHVIVDTVAKNAHVIPRRSA
jgi:hypothetical protein